MICYEDDCPERADGGFCNEVEFCTKTLAEHDAKVKAKAIDEFTEAIRKYIGNNGVIPINIIAEQLKEQKNGEI